MEIIEYKIPESYVCYFVNGDLDNLNEDDLLSIKKFENKLIKKYGHASLSCSYLESQGFHYTNDVNNSGGNVYVMNMLV